MDKDIMGIIFDESEFQSLSYSAATASGDEGLSKGISETEKELSADEKLLLIQYRKLSPDQQRRVSTHMRHLLESVQSTKKINMLKAIEEAKSAAANEDLSDIIKDIVK